MQSKTQGLCRWRARNSSRITVKLSSHGLFQYEMSLKELRISNME
jgi:hypothetical protein